MNGIINDNVSTHLAAWFLSTCSDVLQNDAISHLLAY